MSADFVAERQMKERRDGIIYVNIPASVRPPDLGTLPYFYCKNARFLGAFCPSMRSGPESCSKVSSYKFYDNFGTHLYMIFEEKSCTEVVAVLNATLLGYSC